MRTSIRIQHIFWMLSLLVISTNTNAQSTVLNLSSCIELAIQNSYQLQSDSLLTKAIQTQIAQEESNYHPQISGAIGFTGLFLSPYSFGQHYVQAIADWDLGKFWYKTSELQQKELEQQQSVAEQNKLEIAGLISGLYLDVLQSQLELQLLQTKQQLLQDHLDILSILWNAGTIQELDILQTQSTLNGIKEDIMMKELARNQNQYAMQRLMGLNTNTHLQLAEITELDNLSEIEVATQNNWTENHPLAVQFQKEYETEILRKKQIKASLLPHIQAFSGYTFDGDPTGDGNFVMAGIGASMPIYQWKKNEYRLREIEMKSQSIQSSKNNVELQLSIQYGQLLQQIKQYKKIMEFQTEKIATDERTTQVAEINYKSGLSTNLDVLMAQQILSETKLKSNTAKNQYLKSVVSLYLLTGQLEKIKNLR